ncbi:hypothetical protein HYI05_09535 [Clostridium botulinum]|nr:hypothetical protein [Clostridium botulinum]NFN61302.1 hypothetical protein [Clostridium botulinum]
MDWYMRFLKEIVDEDGTVLFKKDNGSINRRYYIAAEDGEKYYVAMKANDVNCIKCCSFSKKSEGDLFILVQED